MATIHFINIKTGKTGEMTQTGWEMAMQDKNQSKILQRLGDLGKNEPVEEFKFKNENMADELNQINTQNNIQKFESLITDAGKFMAQKNYGGAQKLIDEAEKINPNSDVVKKANIHLKELHEALGRSTTDANDQITGQNNIDDEDEKEEKFEALIKDGDYLLNFQKDYQGARTKYNEALTIFPDSKRIKTKLESIKKAEKKK